MAPSSIMTDALQGINLEVSTDEIKPKYFEGWFQEAFQLRKYWSAKPSAAYACA